MTNDYESIRHADVVLIIGSNTTDMCGVGSGTGEGEGGTTQRCTSTPSCGSPCFAAGIMSR